MDIEKHLLKLEALTNCDTELISELLSLQNEFPYKSPEFRKLINTFINKNKIDIPSKATIAAKNGKDVFRVAHFLEIVISESEVLTVSSVLDFLAEFFKKSKNDYANGMLFEPIRKRAGRDNNFATMLELEILNRKDQRFYGYLNAIYLELAETDFEKSFDKINELIKTDDIQLLATGLRALGLVKNLPAEKIEFVSDTLLSFTQNSEEPVALNATFSICRISERNSKLNEHILMLSKNAPPVVKYEIVSYLNFKQADLSEFDLNLLFNIADYDLSLQGFTQAYDSIVYQLLTKNKTIHANKILSQWIISHSLNDHLTSRLEESFDSTIYEMIKNKDFINLISTEWLCSDDKRFHHNLTHIFSYMTSHGHKSVKFDLEILRILSFEDHLYLIRKTLGYVTEFDILISLMLTFFNEDILDEELASLIGPVLVDHLGYNYMYKTLEALQNELNTTSEAGLKNQVLKACILELEKRRDQLKNLDIINELHPNLDNQIKLNKAFQKSMSKAMKETQDKSPLLNSIHRVSIKAGYSWFSYLHGQYSSPSKMGHYSHSIELPRKDVLDEVGASIERAGFRQVKRGTN